MNFLHSKLNTNIAFLLFLSFFFLILSPGMSLSNDRVYIDITSSKTRKISFAVPYFINKDRPDTIQKFGKDVADIMAKALKFHGIIDIVPAASYGGTQKADLRKQGADYSVLGNYTVNGGKIRFELRFIDVATGKMLLGKSYNGVTDQKEDILFKFCDRVIKELTGQSGIASTKIAYIGQITVTAGMAKRPAKELFVTDILGTKTRRVTRHKNIVVSPRFTTDGNYLCYSSYHSGNQKLYITDLRQSKETTILSQRRGLNVAPAWSPDGNNMILTLSHQGNPDLYLADKRGRIIERLTKNSGANISASWSPDGRQIVFVSDRTGKPQLYLMDMFNKKTRRFTYQGAENIEPSWSKHDNLIVYTSYRKGRYQIFTKKPDPSAVPKRITTDNSNNESPMWSPDGNQIVFVKNRGKSKRIYAIMKNGTFERRLFNFKVNQMLPRWAK